MVNKEFFKQAEEVAKEKGIKIEELYQVMEKALVNSYKKTFGTASCRVEFIPEKNEILLYSLHKVVDNIDPTSEEEIDQITLDDAKKIKSKYKVGDIVEQSIKIDSFGRLAVGAAKSVYTQNIRSLEREKSYNYFKELEGEIVKGQVIEVGDKFTTLNMGHNVTTLIPNAEMLITDKVNPGDFLTVYVKKVEQTTKDPKIFVSRTEKSIITRLLENYIPEIKAGIIEIKGIARDPGDRTKVALFSNDPKVEAIGSCVGENGARIKEIVNQLNGEKIDLYKWSDDPAELIANSLQPSSVTVVLNIDTKTRSSLAVVPDEHLSLAIGKAGQNVRLAVQSCGWKIDIKPTSKAYEEGLLIK